ncbi:MAG: RluA family pseudouridine synthase [Planctomycetaceae bacterium]
MPLTTRSTTIEGEGRVRADVVVRHLSGASHRQVRGMFDNGCVTINDAPCDSGATPVKSGDVVVVNYEPERKYREKKKRWDDRTFTIAYEDDDLIVVDKAAGTLTVPTDANESNTLVDRVSICISHSKRDKEAWLVHRLDRDVSGLLVFGKHKKIADLLIDQFKERKPERRYAAIVAGQMTSAEGTFRSHLATGKNLDRFVTGESADTELAITHYKVLDRLSDTTLIELKLETGRRHQIRVQLSHNGFPVLGDRRYKSKLAAHPKWLRKRIALHAKTLGFDHPLTGKPLRLESPLPPAMAKFLAKN